MAQVIKLPSPELSSIRGKDGRRFPQLYRGVGYEWDGSDTENPHIVTDLKPSDRVSAPFYTLSTEDLGGLSKVEWTPINQLSSEIDSGWVIVRHHLNRDRLEGYLDGASDLISYPKDPCALWVFQTKHGLYTVQHRPATATCPDLLLAYTYSEYDAVNDVWFPEYIVVDKDGTVHDGDILEPEDEGMQAMVDYLNRPR